MFAYCINSPVSFIDFSGNMCVAFDPLRGGPVGASIEGMDSSSSFSPGSNGSLGTKIEAFFTNVDEQAVLEAKYFAFYKGIPVIKTNFKRSGSFGIIFLQDNINSIDHPEDMVRHEYGHIKQLEELGLLKYSLCIFLPSWQMWGSDKYYDKPWEITADILGGVQSRNPTQAKIDAGFTYLEQSDRFGPIAWASIN